MIVLVF